MIKLIGIKRAMLLAGILIVNLLFVGVFMGVIDPMRAETQNKLNMTSSDISRLSKEISNIKKELNDYADNLSKYRALGDRGFFRSQDRFQTARLLEEMHERSGLIGYTFNIDAIKSVSNPDAEKSKSSLITSRITLKDVAAHLDMGIYTLLYNLEYVFPEHARIHAFSIERSGELDQRALQSVAQGTSNGLVEASVTLDWLTVVPLRDDDDKKNGPRGFRGR
ncbi:MAG: hypothetical protein OXT65_11800 [Alphaproteobacteria bacterium]|nr:hypothetical protein [Alphaproteobacteria bacterium]